MPCRKPVFFGEVLRKLWPSFLAKREVQGCRRRGVRERHECQDPSPENEDDVKTMSGLSGKVAGGAIRGAPLRLARPVRAGPVPNTRGVESTRTVEMLRRERLATRVWAAAEDGVDMENIEVVDAVEEDEVSTKDYALLLLCPVFFLPSLPCGRRANTTRASPFAIPAPFSQDYGSSAADLEEVIYSLDKSASVASLMSVIEQKFADQLDPAFLDSGVDGEDYEKHAEIMRNKVKSLGLEERLIEVRRVTKVVKGGNILSFRAIVAVGNKKGKIAVGVGKGKEVMPATTKAVAEALRDIVEFPVAKNDSIPHTTVGSATSASVILKPAGEGTGVIAGGATRTVLELAGVENVLSKQLGSDSLLNNARATVNALAKLRSPAQVAQLRGKTVRQLFGLDDVTKKVDTVECSADRLQELIDSCDTKTKAQIAEGMDFLKVKGFEPEAAEAQVNAL